MNWHILFFVLLMTVLSANATSSHNLKFPLWNETWVDRLRKDLLSKYDKFSRPTQHYNNKTTLYVYLNIMHVEVDSRKNIMNVNTWVRMRWNDEKLKWNPKDYGGVDEFTVGIDEVWQPDIFLFNSALHGVENYESRHGIVRKDGEINWIAPTVFHSLCKFNFVYWPFETNTCALKLGSWTHNGDQIDVRLQDEGFDLEYYSAGEWKVKNVTANRTVDIYPCCPEPYITLHYTIKLSRSSELYYHIVFVVSIPIVFLVLITFWLKPQSEMKLLLNICAVIIDMLFLLYFGFRVPPRIDNNLPLIVRFFSGCLCQMTVSIVISAFVIHISTTSYDISLPRRVRNLLYGKMGKYLGLHCIIREIEAQKLSELQESQSPSLANSDLSINVVDNGDRQCIISQSKHVKRLEWILLATAVDRLSFLLFCCIFAIMAMAYVRINSEAFSKNLSFVNIRSTSFENSTSMDYF